MKQDNRDLNYFDLGILLTDKFLTPDAIRLRLTLWMRRSDLSTTRRLIRAIFNVRRPLKAKPLGDIRLKKMIKELENAGLLESRIVREPTSGSFSGHSWILAEVIF